MVFGLSVYTSFPEYDAEGFGMYLYKVSSTEVFECLESEDYVRYELEQGSFCTPCLHVCIQSDTQLAC
jgi:hypothetical protein